MTVKEFMEHFDVLPESVRIKEGEDCDEIYSYFEDAYYFDGNLMQIQKQYNKMKDKYSDRELKDFRIGDYLILVLKKEIW